MTARKRSADTQLTSCSVPVLERIQLSPTDNDMYTAPNILSKAWALLKSWVEPLRFYTTLTYETEDVVGDDYIQSSNVRIDESASLKRQKTRPRNPKATRARSVEDRTRKSGRGNVDISKCRSEAEARARLDNYWQPRGHPLLKNKSTSFPRPEIQPEEPVGEQSSAESTPRRHSDSSASPLTSSSSPFVREPFILHPTTNIKSQSTKPSVLSPSSKHNLQPVEPATKTDLEKQIEKLLLAEEGARDENQLLTPSSTKEKQRLELFKRREHERAEKLKKEREEKEQAEREARKAALLNRRLPQKRLIQPLNAKWDGIVANAQSQNENKTLTTSIGGTELAPKDFRTLLGSRAWLNDEIINAYIEWVVDAANKHAAVEAKALGEAPSKTPKFIAHNSFFYENLTKKGPASTDRLMKRKGAPGKLLMEVDSLFVPICRGSHWTVGVVRPVVKTIEYFDSYGGPGEMFIEEMRKWLKHQLGKEYIPEEWTEPRTACATQSNSWDCGVFVCTNAFCVGFGIETSCYLERDMAQQRRNIAAVLMNRGFVGDFSWDSWGL